MERILIPSDTQIAATKNITENTKLAIATSKATNSRNWSKGTITWGDFCDWLTQPNDEKEKGGGYIFATLNGTRRTKQSIVSRSAITLDADVAAADFMETVAATLPGVAYAVHTTYKHTTHAPRYRVVIPLARDVAPRQYTMIADVLIDAIGREQFDLGSLEAERFMYRPSAHDLSLYEYHVAEGRALNPNISELWVGDDLTEEFDRDTAVKPFDRKGYYGPFNRRYTDLDELVSTFDLPYTKHSDGRYRYADSTSTPGLVELEEGVYYSHHATDPAGFSRKGLTAFDLVRIHRHGDEDKGRSLGRNPLQHPSYIATVDEMRSHYPEVAELFAAFDRDSVADDFGDTPVSDPKQWLDALGRDTKGEILKTVANLELIFDNDPALSELRFDEMGMKMIVTHRRKWLPDLEGVEVTGNDEIYIPSYIAKKYGVEFRQEQIRAAFARVQETRRVHRVRDRLNALAWDGVPRVDTCMPGVVPTEYSRMVLRKSIVAAVARIMEPGVKWDHVPVLYGREGVGKTYWIERISLGESGRMPDITKPDVAVYLSDSWFIINDEVEFLGNRDWNRVKEFFTTTADKYRQLYTNTIETVKRHNVFWSTTNEKRFILDRDGVRRFLPLNVSRPVDFDALTDEYIEQVWAEAVHLWREGSVKLYLDDHERELAAAERLEYTAVDSDAGVIERYLNTLVPQSWQTMTVDERRLWLSGEHEFAGEGTEAQTVICARQILAEMFGRPAGMIQPGDTNRVERVLDRLDYVERLPSKHSFKHYGKQTAYRLRVVPE